jgi:Fic family protein
VEEQQVSLLWDNASSIWKLKDEASAPPMTNKGKILLAVKEVTDKGEVANSKSVAKLLDLDVTNVSRDLNDLSEEGRLVKLPKQGKIQPYGIPNGVA